MNAPGVTQAVKQILQVAPERTNIGARAALDFDGQLGIFVSDDFEPMSSNEVESLVSALGETPPSGFEYATMLLRKQGLPTE